VPDLRDSLEGVRRQVRGRPDAFDRLAGIRRRRHRRRQIASGAVALAVAAAGVWGLTTAFTSGERRDQPAHTPTPQPSVEHSTTVTEGPAPPLPDGKIVFFVPSGGVYAVDPDGSGRTRLIPGLGATPDWSPDGSRIVFSRGDIPDAESRGLSLMNADGSDVRRLTNRDDDLPAWSPDGGRIAFMRTVGEDSQVWVVNVDGTGLRQVTHVDGNIRPAPSWSPDGERLLFSGRPFGDAYVVGADGTGLHVISNGHHLPVWDPKWSPDGSRIVYSSQSGTGWAIYTMAPDGGDVRRLTHFDTGAWPHPVWAPDGSWIAFSVGLDDQTKDGIYVMDANGEHLTRVAPGRNRAPGW
jgi:Tol biopolymer transport system component